MEESKQKVETSEDKDKIQNLYFRRSLPLLYLNLNTTRLIYSSQFSVKNLIFPFATFSYIVWLYLAVFARPLLVCEVKEWSLVLSRACYPLLPPNRLVKSPSINHSTPGHLYLNCYCRKWSLDCLWLAASQGWLSCCVVIPTVSRQIKTRAGAGARREVA